MMKRRMAVVALLAVLVAGTARAQEGEAANPGSAETHEEAPAPAPVTLASRDYRPFVAARVSFFSGVLDLISVSGLLTALRPVEIELGVSTVIIVSSTYARAGVSIPLINARDANGAGWTLNLPVRVGYRWAQSLPLDTIHYFHGVNGVAGLNSTFWLAPHFGIDLELVLGASYWLYSSSTAESTRLVPDLRLSVGVAF